MKKNIAILIPTLSGGGAERVASNLSLYLSDTYNVFVILHDGKKADYPHKGKLIDLNAPAFKNPFLKLITLILRVYRLKKIKKNTALK